MFDSWKSTIEAKTNAKYTTFEAQLYKTQVVNGINYEVIYKVGQYDRIKVKMYKSFSGDVTFSGWETVD